MVRASLGRSTRSPGDFGIEIDLQVLGGVNDGLKLTLEGAESSLMQFLIERESPLKDIIDRGPLWVVDPNASSDRYEQWTVEDSQEVARRREE